MKRILYVLLAMIFLSGCALSTIRPPKKGAEKPVKPARKPVVERKVPKPKPRRIVVEEKEEILPLREEKEEILPLADDDIK